jgi:hypothetical protein
MIPCAVSKLTSSSAPSFKVLVETENGKKYSSTKKEIDVSQQKDVGSKTISVTVTNC